MALRDRLNKMQDEQPARLSTEKDAVDRAVWSDSLQDLKIRLHHRLIDRIDLTQLTQVDGEEARKEIRLLVQELLDEEQTPLSLAQQRQLIQEVEDEAFGLGPLEPLLHDDTIDDILINGYTQVYVERFGKLEMTGICFRDNAHLMQIIDRVVSRIGRRIDESSPMVDARLPDGSRINVIIPPLALDGPVMSVRRFRTDPLTMDDLLRYGTLTQPIALFFEAVVQGKLSILISGGTGSGKTTLLNVLSAFIPTSERIITIEDASELRLPKKHVVRLETRPPNIEGHGEITQRDLLRNSLRMRPDRIILGEVRGPEALDMLQAMNTGHRGSIATVHANSPRDALSRLETMILLAGANLTQSAMRHQISSAIELVIQVERHSDGVRRVVSCSELVGMEGDVIRMQELFVFEQKGVSRTGEVEGELVPTGIQPMCLERVLEQGIEIPAGLFRPRG